MDVPKVMCIILPFVVNRLNDEAQGGADRVDVLAHNLFDDGGFARIVKAAI